MIVTYKRKHHMPFATQIKIKARTEFRGCGDTATVLAKLVQEHPEVTRWIKEVKMVDGENEYCCGTIDLTLGGFDHDAETQEEADKGIANCAVAFYQSAWESLNCHRVAQTMVATTEEGKEIPFGKGSWDDDSEFHGESEDSWEITVNKLLPAVHSFVKSWNCDLAKEFHQYVQENNADHYERFDWMEKNNVHKTKEVLDVLREYTKNDKD